MFYFIIIITQCLDWKYVNGMPQVQNSRCAWEECVWQYFCNRILYTSINQTCESCYLYLLFCCYSVTWSCPALCNPMDCSTPGFRVHHQPLEFTQTHVHRFSDAIQPSHPLLSPSPPTFNPTQHQGLFKWVSSHQVAKVLECQLQHQSLQWTPRTDLL